MKNREETLGIVGAGPFGLALAKRLARAKRPILLWSQSKSIVEEKQGERQTRHIGGMEVPQNVTATNDVHFFAQSARFMVLAVSSESVQARLRILGDAVDGNHIAVHAIGAFEPKGDRRISEVIAGETAIRRLGVIAGPCLPEDIAEGRVTSLVCASEFDEVTAECRRMLCAPQMRLYRSRDLIGAELASALSGAYTIAVGIADGLSVGIGIRAVLLTRAVAEMSKLGTSLGGESTTFTGLAGLGNILVRSNPNSPQSASYRLGLSLATEAPIAAQNTCEGARAALAGARLASSLSDYPVLEIVTKVVTGTMTANEAAQTMADTTATEE